MPEAGQGVQPRCPCCLWQLDTAWNTGMEPKPSHYGRCHFSDIINCTSFLDCEEIRLGAGLEEMKPQSRSRCFWPAWWGSRDTRCLLPYTLMWNLNHTAAYIHVSVDSKTFSSISVSLPPTILTIPEPHRRVLFSMAVEGIWPAASRKRNVMKSMWAPFRDGWGTQGDSSLDLRPGKISPVMWTRRCGQTQLCRETLSDYFPYRKYFCTCEQSKECSPC